MTTGPSAAALHKIAMDTEYGISEGGVTGYGLLAIFAAGEASMRERAAEAVKANAGYDEATGIAEGVSIWPNTSARAYEVAIEESLIAIRALRVTGGG
jgi:hypothetical protein